MSMTNFTNMGSVLSGCSIHGHSHHSDPNHDPNVVKEGYLAKQKTRLPASFQSFLPQTMKKKTRYFVLRREVDSDSHPACLEYYDSEQKFRAHEPPKKRYILRECLHISRKPDVKDRYVLGLYISRECIALVAQSEAEMNDWLKELQGCRNSSDYEHVWQVVIPPRSLTTKKGLDGHHFVCLTSRLLSLVRVDNHNEKHEFRLGHIRRVGSINTFFFVEFGRFSPIGCGIVYMKTEDSYIAQNMHNIVGQTMNEKNRPRTRSVSEKPTTPLNVGGDHDVTRCRPRSKTVVCPNTQQRIVRTAPTSWNNKLPSSGSSDPEFTADPNNEGSPHYTVMWPPSYPGCSNSTQKGSLPDVTDYEIMDDPLPASPRGLTKSTFNTGFSSPPGDCVDFGKSWPAKTGTLSANHSRSSSLVDDSEYLLMNPAALATTNTTLTTTTTVVSVPVSAGSNYYLTMSSGLPITDPSQRVCSPPTPIPTSPIAEASSSYCEMYCPQSSSSSCNTTSCGTGSSDHLQELTGPIPGGSFGDLDGPATRPTRTSSVGSNPEHYKKKTRLEHVSVSTESGRVRAFSLGSRGSRGISSSLRLGVSRLGAVFTGSNHHNKDVAPVGVVEETNSKNKSKSSSAPMLGSSPISGVSSSWGGTPAGTYFRTSSQAFAQSLGHAAHALPPSHQDSREDTFFEVDLTKVNSGSSQSSGLKGLDIPRGSRRVGEDYCEMDFQHSPLQSKGTEGYLDMTKSSHYMEMSSSQSSCASANDCMSGDDYVDMTQNLMISKSKRVSKGDIEEERTSSSPPGSARKEDQMPPKSKSKKSSKRRSLRESKWRRTSEHSISMSEVGTSPSNDDVPKVKSSGPMSMLTSLIPRMSTSPKVTSALSPQASPNQGTSPLSSLTRSLSREVKQNHQSVLKGSPDSIENSSNSENSPSITAVKGVEFKITDVPEAESPYMNMDQTEDKNKRVSMTDENLRYMNMQPGMPSSSAEEVKSQPIIMPQPVFSSTPCQASEGDYMLMDATKPPDKSPKPSRPIVHCPAIPPQLHSKNNQNIELVTLKEESLPAPSSERSRSHSGPGAPERRSKPKNETKTKNASSSACSSPTSYSPPISPSLGSVSSMSSLSEGGMSSASSTCTVINVGHIGKLCVGGSVMKGHVEKVVAEVDSVAQAFIPTSTSASGDGLNYVALDLTANVPSPRLLKKSCATAQSSDDSLSYAQIDFKRSEGLRSTSIERDSIRH